MWPEAVLKNVGNRYGDVTLLVTACAFSQKPGHVGKYDTLTAALPQQQLCLSSISLPLQRNAMQCFPERHADPKTEDGGYIR